MLRLSRLFLSFFTIRPYPPLNYFPSTNFLLTLYTVFTTMD
nr:MAG TPA: hypothetical protein [Caudoviricetes sp.]